MTRFDVVALAASGLGLALAWDNTPIRIFCLVCTALVVVLIAVQAVVRAKRTADAN